jgi:hypothetical protein
MFIKESSVDFPQPGLSPAVWGYGDNTYILREDVKRQIISHLDSYKDTFFRNVAQEIRIIGSICTNIYTDDADIDVHVVPDMKRLQQVIGNKDPEDEQKEIFKFFREKKPLFIGTHPVEVFLQLNPKQDLQFSAGVYDFVRDTWVKGPEIKSDIYNPYSVFKKPLEDVKNVVKDADLDIGELKRDTVDYEVIKKAISQLPTEKQGQLLDTLKGKLKEIEDDINSLYADRKEWIDRRHNASKVTGDEEDLEDIKLASKFAETNALAKFIDRYSYNKLIKELEQKVGKEVDDNEVNIIKGIMR